MAVTVLCVPRRAARARAPAQCGGSKAVKVKIEAELVLAYGNFFSPPRTSGVRASEMVGCARLGVVLTPVLLFTIRFDGGMRAVHCSGSRACHRQNGTYRHCSRIAEPKSASTLHRRAPVLSRGGSDLRIGAAGGPTRCLRPPSCTLKALPSP